MNDSRTTACGGVWLATLALVGATATVAAQEVRFSGYPEAMYQMVLSEGSNSSAATVPSDARAPWGYSASLTPQPPWVGPATCASVATLLAPSPSDRGGLRFADVFTLVPTVSGRLDRHVKYVEITGPVGVTTDFYVHVRAEWGTAWQAVPGSGLITIDVEDFGATPDVDLAFAGHIDSVDRYIAVRLGPGPEGRIRVKVTTEFQAGLGWLGYTAGSATTIWVEPVNGAYTFEGGYGCGSPVTDLAVTTVPRSGQPFAVRVINLPPTATGVVMLTGLSNTYWGSTSLPWDAGVIGMPGCFLRTDILAAHALLLVSGNATWQLTMPSAVETRGLNFFQQAVVVDPGANQLGLTLSHAYRGVIGM